MATILIVDDDPYIRDFVRRLLEPKHHAVLEAGDAQRALELLRTHPVAVALVDRRLPHEDGFWLIDRIRESFPTVAVVLSTGDGSIPDRLVGGSAITAYMVKPFTAELLAETVSTALVWHEVATKRKQ